MVLIKFMVKFIKKYSNYILYTFLFTIFIFLLVNGYQNSRYKPDSLMSVLGSTDWLLNWPKWLDVRLMHWTNDGFGSFIKAYGKYFDVVNDFLLGLIYGLKGILVLAPWPMVIGIVIAITFFASGRSLYTTTFVGIATFFIGFLNPVFWDKALETTSILFIGIFLCMSAGIPGGIAMARNKRVRNFFLPVLDLAQTIPAFCYLIPGIMLFGLGAVPAIIAIFIYAVPPLMRLTDLGIRLVDEEVIEAADSFGASSSQKLFGIQLPLALPNIMQGINQCTMMALSMVVIASMIGTRGLGDEVLLGLQQLNIGRALEAGISIVLLAIVFDRITQAYGATLQSRRGDREINKK